MAEDVAFPSRGDPDRGMNGRVGDLLDQRHEVDGEKHADVSEGLPTGLVAEMIVVVGAVALSTGESRTRDFTKEVDVS